jgi:hypothetical protein
MALVDLVNSHKIISVIGLAKNTGKTVVVKKLMSELNQRNICYGITSIGHDGEEFDQINHLIKKPRIFITNDNFVATTDSLIKKSDAEIDILVNTNFRTSLGRVVIGKVIQEGNIEISGPSTVKSVIEVCNLMLKHGASKIIVDGAIDRKAISSPQVSNGCIIATGAVLNSNIIKVIKETKSIIQEFLLPGLDDPILTKIMINEKNLLLVRSDYSCIKLNQSTILNDSRSIIDKMSDDIKYVYCNKSITDDFISDIAKFRKGKSLTIVVSDSTKVFISSEKMTMFEKKGVFIKVLFPFNILAITVNPVSPLKHSFNSEELISMFQESINNIPIIDVLSESYS